MGDGKTCFVVMGFGNKTDYQTGRVLDLDKSYKNIIKPAAKEVGLECRRADEIVHAGLIDVPMYEQLLMADVVIADISTSNANAFYELGVRHALRPYTTITIAEDKMIFPLDVTHLAIRKYQHLGIGIDSEEVERMKAELVEALRTLMAKPKFDSPVYTFFSDLTPPERKKIEQAVAQSSPSAVGLKTGAAASTQMDESAMDLMKRAEDARRNSDFATATMLLSVVRTMAPNDPFVVQRLALATYKRGYPDKVQALRTARNILDELKPDTCNDAETFGLLGAINKRLWDLNRDRSDLDASLLWYEKGFYLKNDYYNGINLAYLYNLRASVSSGADATADYVIARRVRQRVLSICAAWLKLDDERQIRSKKMPPNLGLDDAEKEQNLAEKYWVLATKGEAYIGLGDEESGQKQLSLAETLGTASYMKEATEAQIIALRKLLSVVHI